MSVLTEVQVASSVVVEVANPVYVPPPPPTLVPPTILQLAGNYSIFYSESPSVDNIGLDAHGTPLFHMSPQAFYHYM